MQIYLFCFLSLFKIFRLTTLRRFLENQGFYRIPLKRLITGHYQFPAFINDIPGIFILDTGASTSCVGFAYGSTFELIQEESLIKAAGAGAVNMDTMLSRKNKFTIGNRIIRNMDFVLFDLDHVNHALEQSGEKIIHGIIGADFLKKHRAIIDYGRNCFFIK